MIEAAQALRLGGFFIENRAEAPRFAGIYPRARDFQCFP